jgi:hypothetical protein
MNKTHYAFPRAFYPIIGAFIGFAMGTLAAAGIAYAMATPVTGNACLTIAMIFFLMGGVAGAAYQEETIYEPTVPASC